MKAVVFHGYEDVRVENVADPQIIDPKDVILKITSTSICGSDLHLYGGYNPFMQEGDILGHEFMGEVVEIGSKVKTLKIGDRIAVPFNIACGYCNYCKRDLWSLCDNSNPDSEVNAKTYGYHGAGLFGYSHLYGGYAGGQAQFVRVPFADVGHIKIPEELPDEKTLFLTDIFPTGYMAAENANIKPGSTVIVFGCGPVGQFTIRSAFLLGAERVIAIDRIEERLAMAKEAGAETLNYEKQDSLAEVLIDMTKDSPPESVIDAVGMEAHGSGLEGIYDKVTQKIRLQTDRPTALREAIQVCGKGGTVSIPGVYTGFVDKLNIGAAFAKGLSFKMGQTHTHKYLKPLLEKIQNNQIDPSFIITHKLSIDEAPNAYKIFRHKEDNCIKVVLNPWS